MAPSPKKQRPRLARFIAAGLAAFTAVPLNAQEIIEVNVGHTELLRTDRDTHTIIIGEPDIANATAAFDRVVLVTGESLGVTNLIVLDETGREIQSLSVHVVPVDRRPAFNVQLIRGGEEETLVAYRCGPEPGCIPSSDAGTPTTVYSTTVVGGDEPGSFEEGTSTTTIESPGPSE